MGRGRGESGEKGERRITRLHARREGGCWRRLDHIWPGHGAVERETTGESGGGETERRGEGSGKDERIRKMAEIER